YLLGALDPGGAAALEQHLAGCGACRAELARLRPAARILPEAVEPVEPPPGLRARIMAEVEADAGAKRPAGRRQRSAGSLGPRPARGLAVPVLAAAGLAGYAIRDSGSGGGATTVAAGRAPGVTAKMVREGDSGTLRLANVHQLPRDEVLQAWVRRGKRIESA